MIVCNFCENMECQKDGIGCMVQSRKRALDGKSCGDFVPTEYFKLICFRLAKILFRKDTGHPDSDSGDL